MDKYEDDGEDYTGEPVNGWDIAYIVTAPIQTFIEGLNLAVTGLRSALHETSRQRDRRRIAMRELSEQLEKL